MEIWDSDSVSSEGGTTPIVDLAGSLLARVWPPERVLMGMLVCKSIRSELGWNVEHLELSHYGANPRRTSATEIALIHPRGFDVERTLLRFQSSNLRISFHTKRSNDEHYDTIMCGLLGAWRQGWCASLLELDVSGLWILDSGAEHIVTALQHSPSLKYLDMNKTHISDIGKISNALKGATELEHLDLGQNPIGNDSAEALGVLLLGKSKLVHLDMGSNLIESEGVRTLALAECSSLEYLNLSGNAFEAAGMERVAPSLSQCAFLADLHLNACELRDGGAEAVAAILKDLRSLKTLSLCHNVIQSHGASSLAHGISACPSLETLSLGRISSPVRCILSAKKKEKKGSDCGHAALRVEQDRRCGGCSAGRAVGVGCGAEKFWNAEQLGRG